MVDAGPFSLIFVFNLINSQKGSNTCLWQSVLSFSWLFFFAYKAQNRFFHETTETKSKGGSDLGYFVCNGHNPDCSNLNFPAAISHWSSPGPVTAKLTSTQISVSNMTTTANAPQIKI